MAADTAQDWLQLGQKLSGEKRWPAAAEAFLKAHHFAPQNAAPISYLAVALLHLGQAAEAENLARQAVAIDSSNAGYWANLGACLFAQSRWEEAAVAFREASLRDPQNAAIWSNLGEAEQRLGRLSQARAAFEQSLAIRPQQTNAILGLASVISYQGQIEEGLTLIRKVLAQFPNHAQARYNLGRILFDSGELVEAERLATALIQDVPHLAHGWTLLGIIQQHDLRRLTDAESSHRQALELNPQHVDAHWNLSHLQLLLGNFAEGWRGYEWRWKTGQLLTRNFPQPMWAGESLHGQTILLHAEQGLGDTFQFIRYAPLVKSRGGTVIVECQHSLKRLLASCPGIDQLVGLGEELPAFDCHAPFLSLPTILQTTIDTIPACVPYLTADPALVTDWRAKLADIRGVRIGINWHGRAGHGRFRQRDIPPQLFSTLAQVPGIRLISLQKSQGQPEAPNTVTPAIIQLTGDIDGGHGAFMDTAAIMMNLDLVITSDTAIPHLAGALGIPVWLALPHIPDWRWLLNREDSPWYPTMRIFRQNQPGDWAELFARIQTALRDFRPAT